MSRLIHEKTKNEKVEMIFMLLKKGDSNSNVTYLQYGLHIMCCNPNGFDGSFGNGTYNAVVKYQNKKGLTADGIVGDGTWGALCDDIRSIQRQLQNKGFNPGSVDGVAGPNTYNAVIAFQKANGLDADGMVGPASLAKLSASGYNDASQPTLQRGSNGSAVVTLQQKLIAKGYSCGSAGADGDFGGGTYNAVIAFQNANGLAADGIVGPATWAALNSTGSVAAPSTGTTTPSTAGGSCASRASANLIYFIKECEGFAPSLYNDVVGVRTGGYGMTGSELSGLPSTISEATATSLLAQHVNNYYYNKVLSIIKSKGVTNAKQREVDAFTSFAYNLGVGSFQSSTLLKKYAAGSRGEDIHNEFMKWVYAGGRVYQGLVNRRANEWRIFSGSSERVSGYNCAPSISIINTSGNPTGRVVTDNGGYGANPY